MVWKLQLKCFAWLLQVFHERQKNLVGLGASAEKYNLEPHLEEDLDVENIAQIHRSVSEDFFTLQPTLLPNSL